MNLVEFIPKLAWYTQLSKENFFIFFFFRL